MGTGRGREQMHRLRSMRGGVRRQVPEIAEGVAVLPRPDICGSEEHCISECRDDGSTDAVIRKTPLFASLTEAEMHAP
jgi:hypothetical protein